MLVLGGGGECGSDLAPMGRILWRHLLSTSWGNGGSILATWTVYV